MFLDQGLNLNVKYYIKLMPEKHEIDVFINDARQVKITFQHLVLCLKVEVISNHRLGQHFSITLIMGIFLQQLGRMRE